MIKQFERRLSRVPGLVDESADLLRRTIDAGAPAQGSLDTGCREPVDTTSPRGSSHLVPRSGVGVLGCLIAENGTFGGLLRCIGGTEMRSCGVGFG